MSNLDKGSRSMPLPLLGGNLLEKLSELLPNYLDDGSTSKLLDELRAELTQKIGDDSAQMLHSLTLNCRRCPGLDKALVPSWNVIDPDLLIVAEGPMDNAKDREYLIEVLKDVGFTSKRLCLTYLNRCPKKSGKYTQEEIDSCLGYLQSEIHILKPRLVVTLGLSAATSLLGAEFSLKEHRGKIHWLGPWAIMPTYSPGYVRYDSSGDHIRESFIADINKAYDFTYR